MFPAPGRSSWRRPSIGTSEGATSRKDCPSPCSNSRRTPVHALSTSQGRSPSDIPKLNLQAAIERRRSIRSYLREPITLEELSFLLWCTQGVQRIHGNQATFRTVPSAGARHAFETYLLINDGEGLEPGLYRFLALTHRLQQVDMDPAVASRITSACFDQQFILRGGVVFIWTAVPYRMTWRYGERGYRDLHLDAGHVCQNLYLAAEATGCGTCAIAAFDDDDMNAILGINGYDQFVIYLAVVGKKDEMVPLTG